MCTTVLAVIVGLIMVNIMKPGVNKEVEDKLVAAKAKVEAADVGADKEKAEGEGPDYAKQEVHLSNLLGWAIDQVKRQAEKK